jgi:hypothetical protein
VIEKKKVVKEEKTYQHTITEHRVFEKIPDTPFLVRLYYSFLTESKLHLVMGVQQGWKSTVTACVDPIRAPDIVSH